MQFGQPSYYNFVFYCACGLYTGSPDSGHCRSSNCRWPMGAKGAVGVPIKVTYWVAIKKVFSVLAATVGVSISK